MRILFIIPARSKSKGIKDKNLSKIGDRSLLERALRTLNDLTFDYDVIVSSDSEYYLELARSYHPRVKCFLRDESLSGDLVETKDVILDLSRQCDFSRYDILLLLQVTSPFRNSSHIIEAVNLMVEYNYDSLVSLIEVSSAHPFRMKRVENGLCFNFIEQGFEDMRPRQVLPKVYLRNGAIYAIKTGLFLKEKQLLYGRIGSMIMSDLHSVNIDSLIDLKLARLIAEEFGL